MAGSGRPRLMYHSALSCTDMHDINVRFNDGFPAGFTRSGHKTKSKVQCFSWVSSKDKSTKIFDCVGNL